MYIKTKTYYDNEEYVRDLTGCTYKEDSSGNMLLIAIWVVVGILAIANLGMDSVDSDSSMMSVIMLLLLPALAIFGCYKVFKSKTKTGEEEYAKYKEVKDVITSIPSENKWKDIDQAFSDLIMAYKVNTKEKYAIYEVRKSCGFSQYRTSVEPEKVLEYVDIVNTYLVKGGFVERFKELKVELKEDIKKENDRRIKAENERKKKLVKENQRVIDYNYKFLWERLKTIYRDYGVGSEQKLDKNRYIMLENEYRRLNGIDEYSIVLDIEHYSSFNDEHRNLLTFIDCFYLLKTTKGVEKDLKSMVEKMVYSYMPYMCDYDQYNYDARPSVVRAIMKRYRELKAKETVSGQTTDNPNMSDYMALELVECIIEKGHLYGYYTLVDRLVGHSEYEYLYNKVHWSHYWRDAQYKKSRKGNKQYAAKSDMGGFFEAAEVADPEDIEMLADIYGVDLDDVSSEYYDRASDPSYDYFETAPDGNEECFDAYGNLKY